MRNRMKYGLVTILGLLLMLPAFSQVAATAEELRAAVEPSALPEGARWMPFDSVVQTVATISEDDAPVSRTFTFRNATGKPLSITFVRTACDCTTAQYKPSVIAAGETGTVTLTFHPRHRVGKVYERAFVYTNLSDKLPTAVLSLSGLVTPTKDRWSEFRYRAGVLCLMRRSVTFTGRAVGGKAEERILCANSGNAPLHLSALAGSLPVWAQLRTEPGIIAPGKQADLVLTIDAAKLPARQGKAITANVVLQGVSCIPSQRTITITIKPDFN